VNNLPPIVRGVVQRLTADAALMAQVPGGVHFEQGLQDKPLPCVIVSTPDAGETTNDFQGIAFVRQLVQVIAADEGSSANRAQAIADQVNVLLIDAPLDLSPDWFWMSTLQEPFYTLRVPEADLSYQRRGAGYRVMACPSH
jgi:Protein of unknown function (DUF3168)